MPRYLVERTFPEGITLPGSGREQLNEVDLAVHNARWGVLWVHSFVAAAGSKSFCLVEAPTPGAIRQASLASGLPVDRITAVSMLDPYRFVPENGRTETNGIWMDQTGKADDERWGGVNRDG